MRRIVINKNIFTQYILIKLYIISIFLQGFKLFDTIQLTALIAITMFLYRLYISLHNGQVIFIKNPINNILFYLFIIVAVTTIINYYEISLKDYNFTWSQGLNSSKYRSIAFIIRLFLVIYSVYYIVTTIRTNDAYFRIIKFS